MSETHAGVVDQPEGDEAVHDRRGMKLLRIWVPDTASPEFQAEAKRQAAVLKDAEEELETLRFAEAAVDWSSE